MKITVVVLALVMAIAPGVSARPDLLLSTAPDAFYCFLENPYNFAPTVYVIWSNWSGDATRIAFGASASPNSGYTAFYGGSPYTVTGNAESGMVVDFGSCHHGSTLLMQFTLYPTSAGTACPVFQLTPHPSYGGIRYIDCSNNLHRVERSTGILLNPINPTPPCTEVSVPYDPYPPDGASNIPVSVSLEWSFDEPQCGDISGREDTVYFGTQPVPPFLDYWGDDPYPLQPLQPSTTYYWKVRTSAYGLMGTSPVWSFTTASTVRTRQTTWGAIKALYR